MGELLWGCWLWLIYTACLLGIPPKPSTISTRADGMASPLFDHDTKSDGAAEPPSSCTPQRWYFKFVVIPLRVAVGVLGATALVGTVYAAARPKM